MIRWSGWLREILGWILVLVGLYGFFMALGLIVNRQVIGGTVVGVLSVFMYRSGVGFLKMAVAARICQQAQDRVYPAPARPTPVRPGRPVVRTFPSGKTPTRLSFPRSTSNQRRPWLRRNVDDKSTAGDVISKTLIATPMSAVRFTTRLRKRKSGDTWMVGSTPATSLMIRAVTISS